MEKKSDVLLRKLIKNWAGHYTSPDNGRARLLWEASQVSHHKIGIIAHFFRPQYKPNPSAYSNDWTQTFFTWINENSFQYGLQARLS